MTARICSAAALIVIIASNAWSAELELPVPSGPYEVGRRQFVWTDPDRTEIGSSKGDEGRKLIIWIWYPAIIHKGESPSRALSKAWDQGLAFGEIYANRRTHSVDGAEAKQGEPFPVVLFAPGFRRIPTDYSGLIENLASHGYVVVGINPTGFSAITAFPDGEIVFPRHPPESSTGFRYEDLLRWWVDDVRFVHRELTKLSHSQDSLASQLNLQALGISGHSFGGATAAQVLKEMPQFKAGINFDGTLFDSVMIEGVPQPFMLVNAHSDISAANFGPGEWPDIATDLKKAEAGWESFARASPQSLTLTIARTYHGSFSDDALIPMDSRTCEMRNRVADRMEASRAMDLIGQYLIGFFDTYLKDRPSRLLKELPVNAPEVYIHRSELGQREEHARPRRQRLVSIDASELSLVEKSASVELMEQPNTRGIAAVIMNGRYLPRAELDRRLERLKTPLTGE